MNHLRQPSFYHVGSTRRITAMLAAGTVLVLAGAFNPGASTPFLAHASITASRVAIDALSILLAAGPYVCGGAVCASVTARFVRGHAAAAAVVAALAPGCDCSMNGFAFALRRCPAPFAGAALVWGGACNPVALAATMAVLGGHVLQARIAGTLVAAGLTAFVWSCCQRVAPSVPSHDVLAHGPCARDACERDAPKSVAHAFENLCALVEAGLRSLLPAAFAASALIVAAPGVLHTTLSPWSAAAVGALLSPCSSADPMLARVFATSTCAQAAFVIASQCLDLRFTLLLVRTHGVLRAFVAWLCGAIGCATAALLA